MENRFHRYLKDIPFEIEKPSEFNKEHDQPIHRELAFDHASAKDMCEWVKQFGIVVGCVEYFYTPPNGGSLSQHTDSSTFNDMTKINITWGPVGGVIRWWQSDNVKSEYYTGGTDEFSEHNKSVLIADEKDCTLLYEADTNNVSLVNVGILHSTFNPGTTGRYTLCFTLDYPDDSRVPWDHAVSVLQDYIKR
jgi:hypothetical protein